MWWKLITIATLGVSAILLIISLRQAAREREEVWKKIGGTD